MQDDNDESKKKHHWANWSITKGTARYKLDEGLPVTVVRRGGMLRVTLGGLRVDVPLSILAKVLDSPSHRAFILASKVEVHGRPGVVIGAHQRPGDEPDSYTVLVDGKNVFVTANELRHAGGVK